MILMRSQIARHICTPPRIRRPSLQKPGLGDPAAGSPRVGRCRLYGCRERLGMLTAECSSAEVHAVAALYDIAH